MAAQDVERRIQSPHLREVPPSGDFSGITDNRLIAHLTHAQTILGSFSSRGVAYDEQDVRSVAFNLFRFVGKPNAARLKRIIHETQDGVMNHLHDSHDEHETRDKIGEMTDDIALMSVAAVYVAVSAGGDFHKKPGFYHALRDTLGKHPFANMIRVSEPEQQQEPAGPAQVEPIVEVVEEEKKKITGSKGINIRRTRARTRDDGWTPPLPRELELIESDVRTIAPYTPRPRRESLVFQRFMMKKQREMKANRTEEYIHNNAR